MRSIYLELQYHDDSAHHPERRRNSTVGQIEFDGAEGLELTIIEGFHTKQQIPLWIGQLSVHVDRSIFQELKNKASQRCGWYSSFVKGVVVQRVLRWTSTLPRLVQLDEAAAPREW